MELKSSSSSSSANYPLTFNPIIHTCWNATTAKRGACPLIKKSREKLCHLDPPGIFMLSLRYAAVPASSAGCSFEKTLVGRT